MRRRFEDAGGLLDEADRILERRPRDIERALTAKERDDLRGALDRLRDSMKKEPFDVEEFNVSLGKAEQQVDVYLSSWRKSELREYAESIGIAVTVALLLRAFVVEAFKIPSPSMVPTLQVGDHIFVNKSAYGPMIPWTSTRLFSRLPPQYGDVIVFQFPEKPEQDFIKRVVALPGDKLEALDGRPIINGWRPPECKVGIYKHTWGDGSLSQHEGELFVEYLGDEAFLTFFDHAMSPSSASSERRTCSKDSECEPPPHVSRAPVRRLPRPLPGQGRRSLGDGRQPQQQPRLARLVGRQRRRSSLRFHQGPRAHHLDELRPPRDRLGSHRHHRHGKAQDSARPGGLPAARHRQVLQGPPPAQRDHTAPRAP